MKEQYSIKVYKQYFNFACSHFLLFEDGTREPLHGHNYKVQVKAKAQSLNHDMVFDFLDIKPLVREACDSLDHKLLLPMENPKLKITQTEKNYELVTEDESFFSFPKQDVILLPLHNISAELLAVYLANEIKDSVKKTFNTVFSTLIVEVEETPGQSAEYILNGELDELH